MKRPLCCIAYLLIALGAIHFGLIGTLNFNLVEVVLGDWPLLIRILYILIGLSGVFGLLQMAKYGGKCPHCRVH